jgi:4-amino-4-deoxy-L-arabinose transferase-like glycosyltransferase
LSTEKGHNKPVDFERIKKMNKSQLVSLWIGVITFLFWAAYSVASGFYLGGFLPITLAIAALTGVNTCTCGRNNGLSKTKLIIINVAIIVALLIFITIVYQLYHPKETLK